MKNLIQIKRKNVNADKIVTVDYVTNSEQTKQWLVVNLDVTNAEINKLFIEVQNEQEYLAIIEQIKQQL